MRIRAMATAASLSVLLGANTVQAADLGGNCCADLEERIAELEATTARKGNRKVSLTVSGSVNEALMAWDDGFEKNAYVVTNETRRTRLTFSGQAKINEEWSAGYVLELGPRGDRMDRKDQNDGSVNAGTVDVRYSYWSLKSKSLGAVSMGLQPQASDAVTEVTTANTNHFARPAPTQQIGDTGGGYFLRLNSSKLTSLRFGSIVTQGVNGTPGEGHRINVVKYETPAVVGFVASTSWGEDDVIDAGLRYAGEMGGFKLAFAVGFAHWTDGGDLGVRGIRGCAKLPGGASSVECDEVGLSGSVMHLETGLFATGVYGHRQDDNLTAQYGGISGIDDTAEFYSVQAGIEKKWFDLGKTTLFGEYWHEENGAGLSPTGTKLDATPLGAGAFMSGSEISIWGAGINQTLGEGVDVYLSYRHVDTDVFTSANGARAGSTKVSIEPFHFITVGSQIKF